MYFGFINSKYTSINIQLNDSKMIKLLFKVYYCNSKETFYLYFYWFYLFILYALGIIKQNIKEMFFLKLL